MDKTEAIKRIKDHIRVHRIGEYPHIKIAEALNMAISALATDNNVGDEWIPVSERLPRFSPEKWRKVLVTIEDERGVRFTSTAKYDEHYQQWYEFTRARFYNEDKFRVVAWMERPAPYFGDDARGSKEG